ncbi:hypothetical protein [Dongia sp.]|uniref:hypothetical protein n=1 Tax=Dongia sp. TaxID=1977262 RepID=UPI0035B2D1AF
MTAEILRFPAPGPASAATPPDYARLLSVLFDYPPAKAEWVAAEFARRHATILGDGQWPPIETRSTWPDEVRRVAGIVAERHHKRTSAALMMIVELLASVYDARVGEGGERGS